MKTSIFAFAMLTLATASVVAQSNEIVDDVYFKPGDNVKNAVRTETKRPTYKNGAKEIVFIERGQKVEIVTPDTTVLLGQANDSTEQENEEGYYLNGFNGSQSDLEYASRIRKFHNPKYRVFIGDPAYNDIYFLNNFDWNVYVEDNYAYVTPTWTNPYWFDYSFRPYSSWGWNSWGYGYPYYGSYYGWGNYPWSYNNYWGGYGGYYGSWYGGWGGSYYGSMYGYGMGYPYYGYGGYNHGFYDGYYYGNYVNGGSNNPNNNNRGGGYRNITSVNNTVIGGSSSYRNAAGLGSSYTAIGRNNRSVVTSNGSRSIRSAADFQNRAVTGSSTNRTFTERNANSIVNGGDRQTGIRTTENNYRSISGYTNTTTPRTGNSVTTRESGTRSTYTEPRVSTIPRTGNAVQPDQGARTNYSSSSSTTRSSYSTGTPAVTRESRSTYSASPSTSTRSTYNSSSSSSSSSSYRSAPSSSYSSGSSSYSSGSSSSSSSGSSSSHSSSGGGRR